MKKLLFIFLGLSFNVQNTFTQTANDNIGSGNCLDFDGVNDKVVVNSSLPAIGTVSMWFKLNSLGSNARMFGNTVNGNDRFWLGYAVSDATLRVNLGSGGADDLQYTYPYSADTWTHVAVTFNYNTDDYSLVVNGEEVSTSTQLRNQPSANTFAIGDNNNNGLVTSQEYFFGGQIDEVRIWNRALTQAEIKDNMCIQLMGNEIGLIGYWNMNEGTGGTIADLTINGNNGTLQ